MNAELRALLQACHDALCVARPDLASRISDELDGAAVAAAREKGPGSREKGRRAGLVPVSSRVAQRAWGRRLAQLRGEVGS